MMHQMLTDYDQLRIARLLLEYRTTGTIKNVNELCSILNMLFRHMDCTDYLMASKITNLKSKYHLLYNISNAQCFINKYQINGSKH